MEGARILQNNRPTTPAGMLSDGAILDRESLLVIASKREHTGPAQHIAIRDSPARTAKLYDRRQDEISLDEVERIVI